MIIDRGRNKTHKPAHTVRVTHVRPGVRPISTPIVEPPRPREKWPIATLVAFSVIAVFAIGYLSVYAAATGEGYRLADLRRQLRTESAQTELLSARLASLQNAARIGGEATKRGMVLPDRPDEPLPAPRAPHAGGTN